MPHDPVDLLLPASFDRATAVELLGERLRLEAGRERAADRVLLDSFDGRLRKAGLRAERPAGRSGGATLTLYEPGAPVRRAQVARNHRHLVSELPAGPVRDRLAGVLEERALLPAVRLRSAVLPLGVLDGDEKTVVRMTVERPEAVLGGGRRVRLQPRVTVQPVLGYDDAFARTLGVLQDGLGLER